MKLRKTTEEINQILRARLQELHEIAPGSIGDLMHYSLVEGNADTGEFLFRSITESWMRNGPGTLHGGMCATIVDQAMGFVAYCIKPGEGIAPTVEMQVTYHRPLIPGQAVLTRVSVISMTRSLMHLRAEVYAEDAPDKLCLSSTAIYFYKPAEK